MNVAIAGLGAIGVSLAEQMQGNVHVVGFGTSAVETYDVLYRGKTKKLNLETFRKVSADQHKKFDLLIFSLKNQVLSEVVDEYLPLLSDSGYILCAQNGIMEYFLEKKVAPKKILGALIKGNAIYHKPNTVEITQPVEIVVGPMVKDSQANEILKFFNDLKFSRSVDSIIPYKWTKLVFSSIVNPLSAITGLRADKLLRNDKALRVAVELINETLEVSKKANVVLAKEGFVDPYFFSNKKIKRFFKHGLLKIFSLGLRNIKPSMLQDVENHRETEIDYISGFILEKGKEFGVRLPYTQKTYEFIKKLEKGEFKPNVNNLDFYKELNYFSENL